MRNLSVPCKIKLMFPELTESQLKVLMLYAVGADTNTISDILKCSPNSVKMTLRRIKENLSVDRLESARAIYHARTNTAMVASEEFLLEFSKSMRKKSRR